MKKKRLSILGSTGSIGKQAMDIIQAFPNQFEIIGLSCDKNSDGVLEQAKKVEPKFIAVSTKETQEKLQKALKKNGLKTEVLMGIEGLNTIATHPENELLLVAIVGTTAILPTFHAIQKGIPIALACKEVLVSAGTPIMAEAKKGNVPILPVDSEHAALKQCLAGISENPKEVSKLILTASGGPFWNKPASEFSNITLEEALKHPSWVMGSKITIDSSTLMNKGLEVIEAHHLFGIPFEQIEVIVHPKSIVHSLVEFSDGTYLAQLGMPDMRFPIQYALTYPEKWQNPWPKLDLTTLQKLEFFKPDFEKFEMLKLAYETGKMGGTAPAVMNAANEIAVYRFLKKEIGFMDIPKLVRQALEKTPFKQSPTLEEIVALDMEVKTQIQHANI